MYKNEIDYKQLENKIYKKAYKLSDVKDKLEVVAFDIVRFKDTDSAADLWQIQSADDGEYIVALYQGEDKVVEADWKVSLNKIGSCLNFYYKGEPIVKVASNQLGISADEVETAVGYLPEKLATNKALVGALLKELPKNSREIVLNKYPELKA